MGMTVNSLRDKIVQELVTEGLSDVSTVLLQRWATAIARAVINEIQQKAVVTGSTAGGDLTDGRVL